MSSKRSIKLVRISLETHLEAIKFTSGMCLKGGLSCLVFLVLQKKILAENNKNAAYVGNKEHKSLNTSYMITPGVPDEHVRETSASGFQR